MSISKNEGGINLKPFSEIPIAAEVKRFSRNDFVGNPFKFFPYLFEQFNDIFVLKNKPRNNPANESVQLFVNDVKEANRVIMDEDGIWLKGPTTKFPFTSLVPMHLIALEGQQHKKIRAIAQKELNHQVETRLPGIVKKHVSRLDAILLQPFARSNMPISNYDRLQRACGTDVITETVFGKPWGAIEDYTSTNIKAYSLSKLMHELHYRIADLEDSSWMQDPRKEPAGSLLRPLEDFISKEILATRKQLKLQNEVNDERSMLEGWLAQDSTLADKELANLCMTFLTMGHENVSTGISWVVLKLAENVAFQKQVRDEYLANKSIAESACSLLEIKQAFPKLTDAFYEAIRLFPSVPVVSRMHNSSTPVGIMGYEVPAGVEVVVPLYTLHRRSELWGDHQEDFDPERYHNSSFKCPYSSTKGFPDAQPFASGARSCIGVPLTFLEMKCIVHMLLEKYELVNELPDNEPVDANNFMSFRPGVHKLKLIPRTNGKI